MKPKKKPQSQGTAGRKPRWALLGYAVPAEDEEWIFTKLIRLRNKVERSSGELRLGNEEEKKIAEEKTLGYLALGKQRKDHSRVSAKMTAPDLPGSADVIYLAAANNADQPGRFVQWLYTRKPVKTFQIKGQWLDIGSKEMLESADKTLASHVR